MEAVAAAETEGSVVIPRARQDLPRLIKFLGHAVLTFFRFPQDTGTDRLTDRQTVQTVRAKVAAGAVNNSTFIRFCGAERKQQQQHLSLIITNSTHSPTCVCVCVCVAFACDLLICLWHIALSRGNLLSYHSIKTILAPLVQVQCVIVLMPQACVICSSCCCCCYCSCCCSVIAIRAQNKLISFMI